MVTYNSLKEKFLSKGYDLEFRYLVYPVPVLDPQRCILLGISLSTILDNWDKTVKKVYGPEWDYWNTWIDYQQYKFN